VHLRLSDGSHSDVNYLARALEIVVNDLRNALAVETAARLNAESTLNSLLNQLSGFISNVNSTLNTDVGILNAEISNLGTEISNVNSTLSTDIGILNAAVSTLNGDVSDLNTEISNVNSTLNTDVGNLNSEISNLGTEISNVNSTLSNDIGNLSTEIDDVNTTLSNDVATIQLAVNQFNDVFVVTPPGSEGLETPQEVASRKRGTNANCNVLTIFANVSCRVTLLSVMTVGDLGSLGQRDAVGRREWRVRQFHHGLQSAHC
jgi:hypothetical protein